MFVFLFVSIAVHNKNKIEPLISFLLIKGGNVSVRVGRVGQLNRQIAGVFCSWHLFKPSRVSKLGTEKGLGTFPIVL